MIPLHICSMCIKTNQVGKHLPRHGVPIWSLWPNIRFLPSIVAEKNVHICSICIKNQLSRQTGSRNLTCPKTLLTILRTNMKIVTKYQISAINSCWEKCDEKKQQVGKQEVGIWRVQKRFPQYGIPIWSVTKYQISAINGCWEKCDEKYLGRTDIITNQRRGITLIKGFYKPLFFIHYKK